MSRLFSINHKQIPGERGNARRFGAPVDFNRNARCPASSRHKCEAVVVERGSDGYRIVARLGQDAAAAKAEARRLNNTNRDPDLHYYDAHNEISESKVEGEWHGPLADQKREYWRWLDSLSPEEAEQYV